MSKVELSAENVRGQLWDTLLSLKGGKTDVNEANAVAIACREILRSVRIELMVNMLTGEKPSGTVQEFFHSTASYKKLRK